MEHYLDPTLVHHEWNNALKPALTIASGDTVHLDLRMAGHGQVKEGHTYDQPILDFSTLYHLAGPIFVRDARPGSTLRIDVVSLTPGPWGWIAILSGLGLLPDDFPEPWLGTFDLRDGITVEIAPSVRLPLAPFLGTMGVHPDQPQTAEAFPPHKGGGNIDTRHLTQGSTLWLPVFVEGALFSCGDPHALQGDGEVCVSALECGMRATLRLTVEQRSIRGPQFQTAGALLVADETAGHFGAMGIDADLTQGARKAVRTAIDWLVSEHQLSAREAYVLCSLAGDLKIFEIVDAGVWNVGLTIPLSAFGARRP